MALIKFYCSHILTIMTVSLYTLSLGFVNKTVAIMIHLTSVLRVGWMSQGFRMHYSSRGPKFSLHNPCNFSSRGPDTLFWHKLIHGIATKSGSP